MSYVYFIVRLKEPIKSTLRGFDPEEFTNWIYTTDAVKQMISGLYPCTSWEWVDVEYPDGVKKELWGDSRDPDGRFEFKIMSYPVNALRVDGSHAIFQVDRVEQLAKTLNLSALDVQTGEWVCTQIQE